MSKKFMCAAYLAPPPENWDEHRTPGYKNKNFITDEQYSYLEEGGFTHSIALYEYGDEKAVQALAMAQKHNIIYIVRNWDIYGENLRPEQLVLYKKNIHLYKQYASFGGLFIDDEPNTSRFDNLGALKIVYDEITEGKDFFVNLLPTYANPHEQLGAESYEEYIRLFVEKVRPEYIMFDHYPITCDEQRNVIINSDFLYNLEVVAEECKKRDIPMRTFVQSLAYGHLPRDIDGDDLYWQINTQLAYGTSGILYFTYWTPLESHRKAENVNINEREALITKDGRRTDKYFVAKRIHEQIHRFEEIYFRFHWQGVKTVCGKKSTGTDVCFQKVKGFEFPEGVSIQSEYECIAGCFQSEKGETGLLLVNFSDPGKKCSNRIRVELSKTDRVNLVRSGTLMRVELNGDPLELMLECGESVFLFY